MDFACLPSQVYGKIVRSDLVLADDQRSFDDVLQLSDVAGPVVGFHDLHAFGGEFHALLSGLSGKGVHEEFSQIGDVLLTFSQRRQLDLEDGKTEIQVFPELFVFDFMLQVAVGRRDDSHIDIGVFGVADLDELLVLQDTEHLGLQTIFHFSDFIQEDGSSIGFFEKSFLVLHRSGEGSGLVSEQFAFQQFLAEGGAVDGDERLVLARAGHVDGTGEYFFSGSGLSGKQDADVCRCRFSGHSDDVLDLLRFSHDGFEAVEIFFQRKFSGLFLDLIDGSADERDDLPVVVTLDKVVEGTVLDGLDTVGNASMCGQQNDLGGRSDGFELFYHSDSVAVGKEDVA